MSVVRSVSTRHVCIVTRPNHSPCQHRRCLSGKELASIPEVSWRAGRKKSPSDREPGLANVECQRKSQAGGTDRPFLHTGVLYGNSHAVYSARTRGVFDVPRFVPFGSEMYAAFTDMKLSRSGIAFNPWSLLLEMLDDPRLVYNAGNARKLVVAIGHIGWITPENVVQQRPLLARYLLRAGCFVPHKQYSSDLPDGVLPKPDATNLGGVDLTPAQLMQLCQMQWPRFIAKEYKHILPSAIVADKQHTAYLSWRRSWLSTNLSILRLRAAYVKRRVLFNSRMDKCTQSRFLIRDSFEYSPGLVLNTIMSWGGEFSKILNPYTVAGLCSTYFGDYTKTKEAVVQAWQLYEWLIHHNPHMKPPTHLDPSVERWDGRLSKQLVDSLPSTLLYKALVAFDNWEEATSSLNDLYRSHEEGSVQQSPKLAELDNKLFRRYLDMKRARGPKRRTFMRPEASDTLSK
ncbi:hypothetical protein IW146_006365 [Coemansia sp. RSA 922]|nr:hypothetical protein H4S03_007648 [Coemansia sp. S3946]KAJ2071625.1 hypothetical protein GGH13_003231 [Coemansia sp. S155-1]KAJ2109440.1 hypothetical protein IW146_006365 [Coemansia sp. RSA 922]